MGIGSQWQVEARHLAQARNNSHGGHPGETAYTRNPQRAHEIGAIGELWFARTHGLPMPKLRTSGGDEGYDFLIVLPFCSMRIDIKTFCNPARLLVPVFEVARGAANIYVMVHCDERDEPHGIGWVHRSTLQKAPIGRFKLGNEHCIAARNLRPLVDLDKLIDMRIAP